eukprot:Gb_35006 [translate_table: standard]
MLDELQKSLADVIGECIEKVASVFVEDCREWAVSMDEEKVWKEGLVTEKAKGVIQKVGWNLKWTDDGVRVQSRKEDDDDMNRGNVPNKVHCVGGTMQLVRSGGQDKVKKSLVRLDRMDWPYQSVQNTINGERQRVESRAYSKEIKAVDVKVLMEIKCDIRDDGVQESPELIDRTYFHLMHRSTIYITISSSLTFE